MNESRTCEQIYNVERKIRRVCAAKANLQLAIIIITQIKNTNNNTNK